MASHIDQTQELRRARMIAADDTPAKRLERLAEIQIASMAILKGNPAAYQAYLKRNYAARRTEFVDGTWKPVARS
ncbi:MAG: hypothetical protein SFV81_27485 [Pirellulaceae bacterium]|nr:hypothetical protein [Pirellulaceae bacterium]